MKKGLRLLLIISVMMLSFSVVLTGCSGGSGASQSNGTGETVTTKVSPEQRAFLNANPHLSVAWNTNEDVPYSLRGFGKPVTGDTVSAALGFLDEIKHVFKIKDAASEMSLRTVQTDDLAYEHVRFHQKHNGLRVVGGELIVHVNSKKQIYQVNGQYYPDIDLPITARISSDAALSAGIDEFQGKPGFKVEKNPELVVYPHGVKQYVLAYHYIVSYNDMAGDAGRWIYYVKADTGDVIDQYNDIKHVRASGKYPPASQSKNHGAGVYRAATLPSKLPDTQDDLQTIAPPTTNGTHTTISGNILSGEGGTNVNVEGWYDTTNAGYYLYNKNRWWYIYNVATTGTYSDLNTYASRTISSAWGTSDRTEMSAARNFSIVQDYFYTVHGRSSFNNLSAYARANVHYGTNYVNAYWNGSDFTFGDGDGVDANSLTVLDVVAHEYGHAWTDYESNLDYYEESGALNESFSDIIAAAVEFYSQPSCTASYPSKTAGCADWLMGEDCWLSSTALRDMRNPSNTATVGVGGEQPSKYHGTYWYTGYSDNGGVHYNSGPQNFVFYLLSDGGSGTNNGLPYNVTGIGVNNARLVAYRANSNYLTTTSDYAAARTAWISAATDINGSWVSSVEAAWDAIGVIALPSLVRESFEGGILPAGWTTGGNANWAVSTPTARQGSYSLKAGTITHSQSTWVQKTVNFSAAGYLSFFINASSERGWDFADFYVDGVRQARWTGTTVPWTPYITYLTAGSHTLRWVYLKDSSDYYSTGSDTVWIDAITWVPETPTGLSATPLSSTQVSLSWTDNSSSGAVFKVERKAGVGGAYSQIATTAAGATAYSDSGLTSETTYYYRIRASNASGDSPYSNEANATPSALPPAAPSGLTAAGVSATQINLSWTDNSNNESSFIISRKTGTAGIYSDIHTTGANVTTYSDMYSLTTGSTYVYRVRAHNDNDDSAYSNEATAIAAAPSGGGGGGGGCFIATAAYGSAMEKDVRYLRAFRDEYLLANSVGRKFVDLYYQYSPRVADYIREHENLRTAVRWMLSPMAEISRLMVSDDAVKKQTEDKP